MMNFLKLPLLIALEIWQIALIIGGGVLLIIIVLLLVFLLRKKKKIPIDNSVWLLALGGQENIKEVTAIGSRLSLALVDKEKIDREQLKTLGVSSVLTMSNKVTLVIEGEAERIAESIKSSL